MSWKHLFGRALAAAPGRLHVAAHSHHLWPDATRDAHLAAWEDGIGLADHKWAKVFGEVVPAAQAGIAAELGLPSPDSLAFAPNTHEFIIRLVSARQRRPVRILSTDGEFHSFRRQAARWVENGDIVLDTVATDPWHSFADRFAARARVGEHDLIFASHVFFKTGRVFERLFELADLSNPDGPWLVIDGYHGFMAMPTDLSAVADQAFYTAGGYKYAMAGEGAAFLHAPPGFAPRPVSTGWYAEFEDLTAPPNAVGYAPDARRFLGATFDPSGLYRLAAVFDLYRREGLTTAAVSAHVETLQRQLLAGLSGPLAGAELLNPIDGTAHARFLALRHPNAPAWKAALDAADVVTDVRDDVLRIGFGLYHDAEDVDRFLGLARKLLA
ncbi:MAG: class V aminotransferase [Sphingomonadaceae bacterium]|nr:class V aminotransferase [Sphingomonadaceae bacterium]